MSVIKLNLRSDSAVTKLDFDKDATSGSKRYSLGRTRETLQDEKIHKEQVQVTSEHQEHRGRRGKYISTS